LTFTWLISIFELIDYMLNIKYLVTMKTLHLIGWISGGMGLLIVIFAAISVLLQRNLFGFTHLVNYFHAANSFFLLAIALFLGISKWEVK
jgi:hypothetical protein